MAIEREIWANYIVENLYKDNAFMLRATDADQYVLAGKVVHIPQAAAPSGVERNRSSLPATVNRRTDIDITYALDEFTTNPILIPNIDTVQLSYDKMASVMSEDMAYLSEAVAEWMLYNWRAEGAANIVRTSGDPVGSTSPSATGNRKLFKGADLKKAQAILNKGSFPKQGRVALLSSELLSQLQDDPTLQQRDFGQELDMKGGTIARLWGFDIMERSSVLVYDNASTPSAKLPSANGAAADNESALCWAPVAVERAKGTIDSFERLNDPTYYGNIYSFLCMMGGRKRRSAGSGVVAIVQAASA